MDVNVKNTKKSFLRCFCVNEICTKEKKCIVKNVVKN